MGLQIQRGVNSSNEDFEEYAAKAKTLPENTTNENKLILYGLYKQATVGPVNTSRPGIFNMRDRAKWDAWKAVEGKSKEEAMSDYITKLDVSRPLRPPPKRTPVPRSEEGRGLPAMEKNVVMICAAVSFLGLLSAALGFAAEATRIRVSDVQTSTLGQCTYPRSPSLALGLLAAVALMIAQAIISTVAGCICCTKYPNPSDTNWTIGMIAFVASCIEGIKKKASKEEGRVTFIIALVLLLSGAALNDKWGLERAYFGKYCYVVESGVFTGGAVLSLASVALGIVYYVSSTLPKNIQVSNPQQNQGISLGHSNIPLGTRTTPVFVHEDTYIRQQFP
ncbi:hypothetical protein MUK42_08086 [Musa troglodytarum]|uniref:ACB domain-containing protein n=1 Tax=Musa troglodytarum TaxID=320322 RepID=A0A9E7HU86_9LILI|nr:hypothetical protein MUK42_08086 [Musa troglodytarum]